MRKNITPLHMIIAGLLILIAFLIYSSISPGKYDEFAQCLTDKKVEMYGAYWCSACAEQKARFGKSFRYIDYVECTEEQELCNKKEITGYPTWIINNSQRVSGVQTLNTLARISGCKL